MTRNHDYNTPSKGTSDYHLPLNENFQKIDSDVEIRDTESNLSNYDPKDGAKYLSTDTRTVFIGDGSQWNEVGQIKKLPGDVYIQETAPTNPDKNDLWIDTS